MVYAFAVPDTSMESPRGRSIARHCILFADPALARAATIGDIVVAQADKRPRLRELAADGRRTFLRPLNPQFPVESGPFTVAAVVLGSWTPLRG